MKRNYDEFFRNAEKTIALYNQLEKRKRKYGLDFTLTCAEIHIIDEIGRNPGIGVKAIAKNKKVTEGAVSQLIKKLIEKDLITKQISDESEAKVNLNLTEKGMICFKAHIEFHKEANKQWYAIIDELDDENYIVLEKLISRIHDFLEE